MRPGTPRAQPVGDWLVTTAQSRYVRPSSSSIVHRFCCYHVGWDPGRLAKVDECVFSLLGCQLTHPSQIELLSRVTDQRDWVLP